MTNFDWLRNNQSRAQPVLVGVVPRSTAMIRAAGAGSFIDFRGTRRKTGSRKRDLALQGSETDRSRIEV